MNARARVLVCLLCGGCTVGPDFRKPDSPAVDRYTATETPGHTGSSRIEPGLAIAEDWWKVFGSPALDALVARALANSPTLAQARGRLVEAQELQTAGSNAARLPSVDGYVGVERQRIDPATVGFPQAPNPGPFTVYSIGANVAYTFDLFGGTRRELEGLAAEVDYHRYELEGARLTLAANVVVTAIRGAALVDKIAASEAILAAQRRQLAIAEARYAAGGIARFDVESQRALVAQTAAGIPALRAEHARVLHLLAVYVGEPPATADIVAIRVADLTLPSVLPLRLPADLVRQRPDIRAQEALLQKASANIGVATANLYPRLTVTAGLASSQLSLSDLFGNGINIWNIGANLVQPLLRHEELQARKRAAIAAYDQAAAGYQLAVLQGIRNVADVLRALEQDGLAVAARNEQWARSEDAHRIAVERFDQGGVSALAVLDVERQRLQAGLERVEARADQLADAAALFQALGGAFRPESVAAATPGP